MPHRIVVCTANEGVLFSGRSQRDVRRRERPADSEPPSGVFAINPELRRIAKTSVVAPDKWIRESRAERTEDDEPTVELPAPRLPHRLALVVD